MRGMFQLPSGRGRHQQEVQTACGRAARHIYTRHMSLRPASHTGIGCSLHSWSTSDHARSMLNAICLNSFIIKSVQISGCRH